MFPRGLVVVILSLLGTAAYGQGQGKPLPNVLLITVDTLRADHVSSYGYHLRTTPNIDKLAADGVRFDKAYTSIPLTGPSHFSILTSRYAQEHGARINGRATRKDGKLLFLPQVLRRNGYRTAAFVSAWPLTSRLTGLNEFFDHYDEDLSRKYQMLNSRRFAEDVTPRAIQWIKNNQKSRFFVWVHYFDPHSPYQDRKEYEHLKQIGSAPRYPGLNMRDAATRDRIRQYDAEVAYADHYIGKLLAAVDAMGLRDDTLVVLAADHGESLGEHGYIGHGRHLYEDIIHVPLIYRFPGAISKGKVVREKVSLIDVMPTVVDLTIKRHRPDAKLPVELGGHSMAAALGNGKIEDETIRYLTYGGKKGFFPRWVSFLWTDLDARPLQIGRTTGSRKVIWALHDDNLEVFDLQRDPNELKPARPKDGSQQYELETARLDHWYKATESEAGENRMTEHDVEVLKSLGYLQ